MIMENILLGLNKSINSFCGTGHMSHAMMLIFLALALKFIQENNCSDEFVVIY